MGAGQEWVDSPVEEPLLRVVPIEENKFVTCVPLYSLKAAAGGFSDEQLVEPEGWVDPQVRRKLRPGMFVAQVVGKSMEPKISDGSYCLFKYPVEGTRQGKIVLVQLRDFVDPESGERFTVKRYESEKIQEGGMWRHTSITLHPLNNEFDPIVLTGDNESEFQVIAEFIDVIN